MVSGFSGDLGINKIIAVNFLRVSILGPLEERPGMLYQGSVYAVHEKGSAMPDLAVDWDRLDEFRGRSGSPLGCSRVSERVVTGAGEVNSRSR